MRGARVVPSGPMDRGLLVATCRLVFAVVTLVAIAVQLADLAGNGVLDPVNFFSYFTIQSNLIGVAVFAVGAARWRDRRSLGGISCAAARSSTSRSP
jgi:hypothetical protein